MQIQLLATNVFLSQGPSGPNGPSGPPGPRGYQGPKVSYSYSDGQEPWNIVNTHNLIEQQLLLEKPQI